MSREEAQLQEQTNMGRDGFLPRTAQITTGAQGDLKVNQNY